MKNVIEHCTQIFKNYCEEHGAIMIRLANCEVDAFAESDCTMSGRKTDVTLTRESELFELHLCASQRETSCYSFKILDGSTSTDGSWKDACWMSLE